MRWISNPQNARCEARFRQNMYNLNANNSGTFLIVRPEDLNTICAQVVAKIREDDATARREASVEEWGTRADACDYLKISFPTFHSLVHQGLVKTKKVGRKTLVDMNDLRKAVADGRIVRYKHGR